MTAGQGARPGVDAAGSAEGGREAGRETRPLVTFALFAYNQEAFIREAVEGAFAQTYSPLEIILSDDCSSDRTFQIMQDMAAAYRGPHRVVVEQTPTNLGRMTFGRRVWSLLSRCKGELIVLAAGDDVSLPDRTQSLFSTWDSGGRNAVCVHSKALPTDEHGHAISSEVGDNEIATISLEAFVERDGMGLIGATNAVSKELLHRFGPLPDVLLLEDGALALRAKLSDGILFVPKPLVKYRRHGSNLTNQDEIKSKQALSRYVRGLIGQHNCYLADYLSTGLELSPAFVKATTRRLDRASRVARLVDGKLFERILAVISYSDRFSLKRRIWLLLHLALFPKRQKAG